MRKLKREMKLLWTYANFYQNIIIAIFQVKGIIEMGLCMC